MKLTDKLRLVAYANQMAILVRKLDPGGERTNQADQMVERAWGAYQTSALDPTDLDDSGDAILTFADCNERILLGCVRSLEAS